MFHEMLHWPPSCSVFVEISVGIRVRIGIGCWNAVHLYYKRMVTPIGTLTLRVQVSWPSKVPKWGLVSVRVRSGLGLKPPVAPPRFRVRVKVKVSVVVNMRLQASLDSAGPSNMSPQ